MKRIFLTIVFIAFLISACAPGGAAPTATKIPADIVYATPDVSMSIPASGSATAAKLQGVTALLLRSRPDIKADLAGQVLPGDTGKILGLDSTGRWVLVQFKEQTGWVPAALLELTIAQ